MLSCNDRYVAVFHIGFCAGKVRRRVYGCDRNIRRESGLAGLVVRKHSLRVRYGNFAVLRVEFLEDSSRLDVLNIVYGNASHESRNPGIHGCIRAIMIGEGSNVTFPSLAFVRLNIVSSVPEISFGTGGRILRSLISQTIISTSLRRTEIAWNS